MPKLSKVAKQTKRFGPQVVKMAKDYGPKVSDAARDYASKAGYTTKEMASKASHYAADYGKKAKNVLPDKKKHTKEVVPVPVPVEESTTPMRGLSLTKSVLIIGASAIAALLFAPKSGKELRSDMKTRSMDMKDKGMEQAKGTIHNVRGTVTDKVHDVKGTVTDKMHRQKSEPPSSPTVGMEGDTVTTSAPPMDAVDVPPSPVDATDTLATDEYESASAYDSSEQLAVPLDEEMEPSALTPETDLPPSDNLSKELLDAMNEPSANPPEHK